MIVIPATVEGINTRKDSTLKIVLGTQELTPEKAGTLFHLQGKLAYVAIKEENFTNDEADLIKNLKVDEINTISPSKRLRAVMYLNWKQDPEGHDNFVNYYLQHIEKLIEKYKGNLN